MGARSTSSVLGAATLGWLSGCSHPPGDPGGIASVALRPGEIGSAFVSLPADRTGLEFTNRFDWDHPRRHLFEHGFAGGGVAVGDVDADGKPDLYLTSQTGSDALYRQVGDLRFEDVTVDAGIDHDVRWGAGAAFGDVDGDGALDLFVACYDDADLLYRNQGDGHFDEVGAESGVAHPGAGVMGAFADFDRDGDLDLYLVTNRLYPGPALDVPRTRVVDGVTRIEPGTEEQYQIVEANLEGVIQRYVGKSGQADRLYENAGDGGFRDVTEPAGVLDLAPGLSATWWDQDTDGWPDLYVGNDYFAPDRMYRNDQRGGFVDVLREAVPTSSWFTMGTAAADLDDDGRLDLIAADMSPTTHYRSKIMMGDMADSRWFLDSAEPRQAIRNVLYRNTGTHRFQEAAYLAGLASTDWTWSVKLGDLDCDGRIDAFFTNGSANNSFDPDLADEMEKLQRRQARERRELEDGLEEQWQLYRSRPPRRERNLAFRNAGGLSFDPVGKDWGLDAEVISYGAALADLDRDGDLDLVTSNVDAPVSLFRNDVARGHRVLIRLVGKESERFGRGARVELQTASGRRIRFAGAGDGYMSADEPLVHFGLGTDRTIDRLTVRWPSGHVQTFADLAADRFYTITEPPGEAPPAPVEEALLRRYRETSADHGLALTFTDERPFDDYARQPLLPARLSRLGPGLAWGDANGDGLDDLFASGSAGRAGTLLVSSGLGFVETAGPWVEDAESEDMGPLWFDADGDGDLDLFVASGGIECAPGDAVLADRLYVNDGAGRFERDTTALPDLRESSSTVAAADLEGDGDLDLFVGARSIPGRYPETPASALLTNEGGRFVEATEELAPGLRRRGMVTCALWTDADGDGRADLLVAHDWGPVSYWHNLGGRLAERTEEAGLANRLGWWSSLTGADLDADGDIDVVAGNAGLNTKYAASAENPALLYHGDFEGRGIERLVEARSGDELLPVRGLSCSVDAMPTLRARVATYDAFARATLPELYTEERLGDARRYVVNELASGVLVNETQRGGPVRFGWRPLPRLAQVAPVCGVVAGDFDGDGDADVYLAQNQFQREPETGRWAGGVSQLLDGDGQLGFQVVDPAASALVVPGDTTALTVCDPNGDGRPDFALAENGGRFLLFEHAHARAFVALSLAGPAGNPSAVGARVRIESGSGAGRVLEVRAGSGALSQSVPTLFLGAPATDEDLRIHIRWPDGTESTHTLPSQPGPVELEHPEAR